ncbi:MAG: hypothetical protein P1V35_05660 [Planctomycetota bacterium]|nr:hypothetical protein [Planctomycetota bacterium]
MKRLILPLIVAALVTPLSIAAMQNGLPDTSWATVDQSAPPTGLFHEDLENDLWSRGPNYKANFSPDRVQFVPFLGSEADRLYPLAWNPAQVWRGSTQLVAKPAVLPVREGEFVLYKHERWTEGYSIREAGIEQWFRFEDLPDDGDLVVSMAMDSDTEFQVEPWKGGLRFSCDRGGVDYGAAQAFDGEGRELPAHVEWTGDAIQIRVNSADLVGAALPITVDPLISVYMIDNFGTMLRNPDLAYDVTTNSILVVYEEIFAGPDTDLYFRQFDADTRAVLHQGYLTVSTNSWTAPKVANNNYSDSFLVVFETEGVGVSNVSFRTISALDGTLSPVRGVSATEFVSNSQPDVGGEIYDGMGSYFLIVWVEEQFAGTTRIMCTRVSSDGLSLFDNTELAPIDSWAKTNPAVSNTSGASGAFNLVWATAEGAATNVRGAQVLFNGTVVDRGYLIGGSPLISFSYPTVSPSLEDGDVGSYLVVFPALIAGAPIGHLSGLTAVLMDGSVKTDSMLLDPNFQHEQTSHSSVDTDGSQFVVGFNSYEGLETYPWKAHLSTVSSSQGKLCHSDIRVPIQHEVDVSAFWVGVTTERSGGGFGHSLHMTWIREAIVNDYDVIGAEFGISEPDCLGHIQLCTPTDNSSGQPGRTWAFGSYIAADRDLVLMADQLPPNQIGYFLAGTGTGGFVPPGSQGQLCLAGSLGRFNRNLTEVQTSGAAGEFSVTIDTLNMPIASAPVVTAGSTWFFQAWHRDLNPGQTSNFSTLLGVSFD